LCIDHKENRLFDAPQNIPTLFVVVAGDVELFKPSCILEDLTSLVKWNPMLTQVGLSFRGIPLELHV